MVMNHSRKSPIDGTYQLCQWGIVHCHVLDYQRIEATFIFNLKNSVVQGGKHQNLTKKTWCSSPTESTHCYIIYIPMYPGIPIAIAIIAIPMASMAYPHGPYATDRLETRSTPKICTPKRENMPSCEAAPGLNTRTAWPIGSSSAWRPQGCGKKRGHGCKKPSKLGYDLRYGLVWIEFVT